jgi:hypothetical protein
MTNLKGTPMYWAPEAFSRVIGRACDWWGFGMMALEMLLGEHPFEGLSDSRIIRQLTISNVEIPEPLGPDWSLLIKGLLTKDDAKRWGYGEVCRWLAGARDIPVFYEEPGTPDGNIAKPFQIAGISCHTVHEIAEAIACREEPWNAPADYLRFIRQWYESNLMFDDAASLGSIISKNNPDIALFRFVHSNAKLPFLLNGHEADIDGLCRILGKVAAGSSSNMENRVAAMLEDGSAVRFYEEYANFAEADAVFHDLLCFLTRKPPAAGLAYVSAIRDPGSYIWPEDAPTETENERVNCVMALAAPPFAKTDIEKITAEFVIPDALLYMLRSTETYTAGISKLEHWRVRGLMLERGSDEAAFKNLSVGGYEAMARVRCLGHSSSVMKNLDSLSEKIDTLDKAEPSFAFTETLKRFTKLRDEKISAHDLKYMDTLSKLFSKREKLTENRRAARVSGALIAVIALAIIRAALSMADVIGDNGWYAFAALALIFAPGVFSTIRRLSFETPGDPPGETLQTGRAAQRRNQLPPLHPLHSLGCAYVVIAITSLFLLITDMLMPMLTRLATPGLTGAAIYCYPLAGAPLGAAIAKARLNGKLKENSADIVGACDNYVLNVDDDF